jgi:hypothetical protein
MEGWFQAHYVLLKDFSGPVATAFVGLVALFITYSWNRRQAVIALDKLKFDLFERRYAVYVAAQKMLQPFLKHDTGILQLSEYREVMVKVYEARFFFGPNTQKYLEQMTSDWMMYQDYVVHLARKDLDEEPRFNISMKSKELWWRLNAAFDELPKRFEKELGFRQLMRGWR